MAGLVATPGKTRPLGGDGNSCGPTAAAAADPREATAAGDPREATAAAADPLEAQISYADLWCVMGYSSASSFFGGLDQSYKFFPGDVDDAVTLYTATLTHIINTVVPLTTRTIEKDRNCPWYTLDIRVLKSACRKLECKWRSSGQTVHREIWTDNLTSYRRALATAKVKYFSGIITM
ncbi:UNVERIFIED_CONTAM: hypothetical protein FKN15_031611 [Acipenser sinensis]